ncbi:MAG: hypothetical protein IJZ70_03515 [Bacteroidales bacterium]|nr:hypothetical protein [Bacteroidales bacterium]MBQ8811360.1 hypothetical protein [Bacteroidales bacterium]
MEIRIDFTSMLWTSVKAHCPICNKTFTNWYCPTCGLPKKNSKYAIDKGHDDSIHNCDKYHFRPEFSQFEDFKLCSKCCTTNPYHARYCRNCGEDITSKAMNKNGHGWVDLGLSVLWSTEELPGCYMWMRLNDNPWMDISFEEYKQQDAKDTASYKWGDKWRMPTKEEFEELVEKCTWEKVLVWESRQFPPYNGKYQKLKALKITGPNGNHILILPNNKNTGISYWTATKSANRDGFAERFYFSNYSEGAQSEDEQESSWLSTPFDKIKTIHIREGRMQFNAFVRPVADIKWKGKL